MLDTDGNPPHHVPIPQEQKGNDAMFVEIDRVITLTWLIFEGPVPDRDEKFSWENNGIEQPCELQNPDRCASIVSGRVQFRIMMMIIIIMTIAFFLLVKMTGFWLYHLMIIFPG